MKKLFFIACATVAMSLVWAGDSAETMLAKIDGMKAPTITQAEAKDQANIAKYMEARKAYTAERNKAVLDFAKAYPTHERTAKLMSARWAGFPGETGAKTAEEAYTKAAERLREELKTGNWTAELKGEGEGTLVMFDLQAKKRSTLEQLGLAKGYLARHKGSETGARILSTISRTAEGADKKNVLTMLVKDFGNTKSAKYAGGELRQMDAIGKPFDLNFTDLNGNHIDMNTLKGKVVMVDFWATWCGPCIAEMPRTKELYAKYHDQGFEIIGVSLDQPEDKGGLTKLKDYVAKNDIKWPQYYQGNYWDSAYSASWGINSIPRMFLIDKHGNLVDLVGRQDTDAKVAKLLAEK